MFKRFVSGATAFTIALTMSGVSAFADNDGYPDGDEEDSSEIIEEILTDENYLNSDNYIVQELLNELREEENGLSEIETDLTDPGGVYLPQWSSGGDEDSDHANIVKNIISCLDGKIKGDEKSSAIECMIYGSYTADDPDFHHKKGDSTPNDTVYDAEMLSDDKKTYALKATQLHGVDNYMIHLKALWLYSLQVSNVTYDKKTKKFNDVDVRNEIFNSMIKGKSLSNSEKNNLKYLLASLRYIFVSFQKNNLHSYRELTNTEKKFLIIGLALHEIGDIYAHRACLPLLYADTNTFNKEFKNTGWIKSNLIEELKTEIASGNCYGTRFTQYYVDSSKIGKKKPNQMYEDNTSFYPERYEYSIECSENYVNAILGVNEKNKTVSYLMNTFVPSNIIIQNGMSIYSVPQGVPIKLFKYKEHVKTIM